MYCGRYAKKNRKENDESFYIAYNMHWEEHDFALPALPEGCSWVRICDTFEEEPEKNGDGKKAEKKPEKKAAAKPEETAGEGRSTCGPGRSIRILISSVPDPQKKADRKGRTKGQ